MGSNSHTNYVLICGLIRDEIEFRVTLAQMVDARAQGLFEKIVLSTWYGEIDSIPGLRAELNKYGVTVVESTPPPHKSAGNTWAQHKALLEGLRIIPDGTAVWRIRTDRSAHLLRPFRPFLEAGPSPCRSFGALAPIFKMRVAAFAVISTAPYYAADFSFYGLKEDLLSLVTFDAVYDCLYRGFGAEVRVWTHPFLKAYPQLNEAYEHLHILGLSTHVVNAARAGKSIPDFLLRLYAFYWITLYNNIQVVDMRGEYKNDMTLFHALGALDCSGMRQGTVASHFTVNVAGFNQQEALDHLVTGPLEDDTENYQRLTAIMDDYRERGTAAMPVWSETTREEIETIWEDRSVELFLKAPTVTYPEEADITATEDDAGEEKEENILSGMRFRQLLMQESKAPSIDDDTLKLISDTLELTNNGFDTGKLYLRIANDILVRAADERPQKMLGGFFLLRAAERGDVEAASKYAWLVYSGRLEADAKDHAIRWARTAATKENPLAQHTLALMFSTGWHGERDMKQAQTWQERALKNGFTPEMLVLE